MIFDRLFHRFAVRTMTVAAVAVSLAGCDNMIYEDEGDCDPHYKVRFIFDMNMKYADAFPAEVNAVTLYVIDDATGNVVLRKSESGDRLKAEGYMMDVDVAPGTYSLLAWCGEGVGTHFSVADHQHHTGLTCTLLRDSDDNGAAVVDHDLNRLYHGHMDAEAFPETEGDHIYTVPLIKDTNDVNIVLQNLSGAPLDKDDFSFSITDANGSMDWDNSLLPDEQITYKAFDVRSGTAGIEYPEARAITQVSACVASLTVARLVKGNNMLVRIYNKATGERIASLPLIDYALLVKGRYDEKMTDQEYLDRQDKYDLVLFIDENKHWLNSQIYINSWKIVLNDADL